MKEFFRSTREGRVFIAEGTVKTRRGESALLSGNEDSGVVEKPAGEMCKEARRGGWYRAIPHVIVSC